MYNSASTVVFLGMKKQSFQDSELIKIDTYDDGEVDSWFVQANNPIVNDIAKIKPMSNIYIEFAWSKNNSGWKHRLISVAAG